MPLDFDGYIPRSYDAVVDVAGGRDFTTLQDAIDELVDGFSMWVKEGTFAAGFTLATHLSKITVEPGTVIQAACILSGDKNKLLLGGGADIQALITLSGDVGVLVCQNGVDTIGVLMTGDRCFHDGGGWATLHDGGILNYGVRIDGADCIVRNCAVQTTTGGGVFEGVLVVGARATVVTLKVVDAGDNGIVTNTGAADALLDGCVILGADNDGIALQGPRARVIGIFVIATGAEGIHALATSDNSVVDGNIIKDPGTDPILIDAAAENCVVVGNRTDGAVVDNSGTSVVANNNETAF